MITETTTPRGHRRPGWTLPAGTCDCHAHVFGPYDRFPVSHAMHYVPPLAPAAAHRNMLDRIGISNGVLVQPGAYGADATAILDATIHSKGRVWGVAAAGAGIDDPTLDIWHTHGVRGLRFNDMTVPGGTGRFAGAVGTKALWDLAPRLQARGWHAEVWATIDQHAALLPRYHSTGVPIVLDHMAGLVADRTIDDPAFQAIVAALRDGWLWVKLVLCRCSKALPDYPDLRPFHDALIAANPERLVWGSDWPHLRLGEHAPDIGHLLDLFEDWVPDAAVRQQILVDNPRLLYGF